MTEFKLIKKGNGTWLKEIYWNISDSVNKVEWSDPITDETRPLLEKELDQQVHFKSNTNYIKIYLPLTSDRLEERAIKVNLPCILREVLTEISNFYLSPITSQFIDTLLAEDPPTHDEKVVYFIREAKQNLAQSKTVRKVDLVGYLVYWEGLSYSGRNEYWVDLAH